MTLIDNCVLVVGFFFSSFFLALLLLLEIFVTKRTISLFFTVDYIALEIQKQ